MNDKAMTPDNKLDAVKKLLPIAEYGLRASRGRNYPESLQWTNDLADAREAIQALTTLADDNKRLREEIHSLMNTPPCRECGAMTEKDAETKCRCAGDKDHCHGCDLWDR